MNNVFKIFVDWLIIIILINYFKIKINKNFFWKYLVNYIIISSDVWKIKYSIIYEIYFLLG